jgi:hypothetical protein
MFTRCWRWLVVEWNWPAAAVFAGCMLLPFVAMLWHLAGPVFALVALQLPLYMLHQGEEHLGDRFRRDVNVMFGGEVLSPAAAFWINSLGVWGVDLVSILLAVFVAPAWGAIAIWLTLFNGATHILAFIARRRPNPGLVTSIVLFLPLGGAALWTLSRSPGMTTSMQWVGFGTAWLVHAAIIAWIVSRRRTIA